VALPFTRGPIVELPFVRTSLVGRIAEIATARGFVLDDAVPVLTITGPGGVGKTRLALAIAREVASATAFADGVYFVDLTPFRDPAQVLPAIAQVLELRPHGDQSLSDLIVSFLKSRQLLLMLDNFEQILPAAAEIADLLAACPALQVLATSRAPLRIRGEHLFPISPLALPTDENTADLERLGRIDALTLFTQRARAANPTFALTASNAAAVTDICRRVDGLPLAIELAAARLRHLSPEALLSLLSHRLKVLTDGDRDAPSRQRTQRDTIAWSYDLLTAEERAVFRHFAVFVGGFDAEAGLAIAGEDPVVGVRMLGTLVDQSLVQRYERPDGTVRFGMLETVREFALEHLEQSGELPAAQKAHAAYFHDLTERAEADMYESNPRGALDRLEVEYPNCLAALDYFAACQEADGESWFE
jgi:predicted ATPase